MSNPNKPKIINVGLLGLGTVGAGVYEILVSQRRRIQEKTGVRVAVKKVGVRALHKKRGVRVPGGKLTTNVRGVLKDPAIDIVVELAGGVHPAKEWILEAFRRGKHVVTANKALLAEQGEPVYRESFLRSRRLGLEASVCGGIPIIKALTEGLVSDDISHFFGIVNGTCNYILTEMSQRAMPFQKALARAQAKGYAEKDPRLDVEGTDSAHKLAILARLAFRSEISFGRISVEGIRHLAVEDIGYAAELGYVVKLLAIGKKWKNGLELRVHPTMLPLDHPLSNVHGAYNAVFVRARRAGDLLFYGRGAGKFPTASAVVSDILDIARDPSAASGRPIFKRLAVLPTDDVKSKYYLRFQVEDRPGVLGRIARALGGHKISILSVHQKESHETRSVPVVILTYEARERDLRKALETIRAMRPVSEKPVVLRVEK
ncbi:MAG: homoserine dehydrogenase [Candidatus Omnitrophica bacterium]|nr:homoserine dehydrogenase [Candidatus Omnitrophota bacterium]